MNIQTSYPIFENGQVLTSAQLNDLTEYLEEQDRLSRRALSGIGVVCGLDVDVEGAVVNISKGVAVTSEGFLITAEAQAHDRFRLYEVPVPTAAEASAADIAEARYPFLFPDGETQIPVFELLDTDFAPAPGEPDPSVLTAAFLADKTVMLFLECRLEALKSCDVNDCADKGAERRFTLRRLLVTRAQADAMLAQEAAIAGRPVEAATHPRLDLPYLRIEKLGLARHGIGSFAGLFGRVLTIALKLAQTLPKALRAAYAAYEHLLGELYAEGEEPFPDTYFSNLWGQFLLNIFMVQYFYDYMRDVAMAYNEFVEAAASFETECLPDPARFPKHVLLGDATAIPDAFTTEFPTAADVLAFDQNKATAGVGLAHRPRARRTHFTPSPAARNRPRLEEVRALFLRMHLLALTYRTQGLMAAPIRLTPSRDDAAPLSERAIPFHYAFDADADLFRNWSPRKTRANLLNTVYSYRFSAPDAAHPFFFRIDDQDFIRVEGVVGKPLGSAMAELIACKQALGLSFSIEPVFMKLTVGKDDPTGAALDAASAKVAAAAARKLLLCRFSELDLIFLVVIRALFAFLVFLIQRLGRQNVAVTTGFATGAVTTGVAAQPSREFLAAAAAPAAAFFDSATANRFRIDLTPKDEAQLRLDAETLRLEIAAKPFDRGDIIAKLNPDAGAGSAAKAFDAVKDEAGGGNLFDRTRALVLKQGGDEAAVQTTYANVALLAQGEAVLDTLRVESIADFDEVEFSAAYRGFSDAYLNYADKVEISPNDSVEAARDKVQIKEAAATVASQTTTFAAANIQSELGGLVARLLAGLTLDGYAKRHPGLEHRAGVKSGGALILAYVSLDDLAKQAGPILGALGKSIASLTSALSAGGGVADPDAALKDLATGSAGRTEDPLDRFVVLADFCLPYQCCDADCSDVVLSERIIADPFGDDVDPGPMVVPPLDPARPGGGRRPIRDIGDLTSRPPVSVSRPARGGLTGGREEFVSPSPAPREEPGAAALFGVVGVEGRRGVEPVAESTVRYTDASGADRSQRTDAGAYRIKVAAGEVKIIGAAPGFRGASQVVTLRAGEARELDLIVVKPG